MVGAPATLAALAAGRIHPAAAHAIAEGLTVLHGDVRAQAEQRVLAHAGTQTPAQVAAYVRRTVIAADPEAADRAYHKAKAARRASCQPEPDGMASIWVTGTADQITRAWQTATAVAEHRRHQARQDHAAQGEPYGGDGATGIPTLDQARADAILDLLSSPDGLSEWTPDRRFTTGSTYTTGTTETSTQTAGSSPTTASPSRSAPVTPSPDVHVNLVMPIDALSGQADGAPAELVGYGPVPPAFVRDLIGGDPPTGDPPSGNIAGVATGTRVRFLRWLTDPTGIVTTTSGRTFTTYRPPASLDATVRARDVTCRFPGCRTPARYCDLDHTVAYPVGDTTAANLACLCRRHHRLKTHHKWKVQQLPGARLAWTTPTGYIHITSPPTWATGGPTRQSETAGPTTQPNQEAAGDDDPPPF